MTLFFVCDIAPLLTTEAADKILKFETTGVARYKTSPTATTWTDATAKGGDPFALFESTGYLWIDLNGNSDCHFDLGIRHPGFSIYNIGSQTGTLILTSSGGKEFKVFSGHDYNLLQ